MNRLDAFANRLAPLLVEFTVLYFGAHVAYMDPSLPWRVAAMVVTVGLAVGLGSLMRYATGQRRARFVESYLTALPVAFVLTAVMG